MTEQISDQWVQAVSVEAIPEEEVIGVDVGGKEIALYRVDGQVYATDNICTHGHARLCDGFLEGHEIECPLHQGKFDIRDGRAMCAPLTVDVRTYPIRIEEGKVFVAL
ncbi:non-heme iron oxygenase ferredoxin subunit [Herbaspirillum huttiense]|uniref:non-heme iron oxygenase ferredoxin subunit n=1 Tax=Herbaspirillum huttiense TaxID=863372 RepID=UPI00380C91C7